MLMSEKNCDKSVLMVASVASMIDLFNEDNINILQSLGYIVHVMTNFENGSIFVLHTRIFDHDQNRYIPKEIR